MLSLSPGVGPVYSRVWTSSLRTAALQIVCDSTALCLLLLHMRWFCLCWLYRKHFQAQLMWDPRDALISERKSIDVAKIMLCNGRNPCKPPLAVILLGLTPRMWGGWWGWFLSPLPVQGWQGSLFSFSWSTWVSLPARCCQQFCSWSSESCSRASLDLSKTPFLSFPDYLKHSCGGELNPKA